MNSTGLVIATCVTTLLLSAGSRAQQPAAVPVTAFCVPADHGMFSGEAMVIRALVSDTGSGVTYRWTTSSGQITGIGQNVTLLGAASGLATVSVSVVGSTGVPVSRCQTTIGVVDRPPVIVQAGSTHREVAALLSMNGAIKSAGTKRVYAREAVAAAPAMIDNASSGIMTPDGVLLAPNAHEVVGFGRYTYLLIGQSASATDSARYMAIFAEVIRLQGSHWKYKHAAEGLPASRINAFHLPVDKQSLTALPPDTLLKHYDYVRARGMLTALYNSFPVARRPAHFNQFGIYAVSVPHPIGAFDPTKDSLVVFDFTTMETGTATRMLHAFFTEADEDQLVNDYEGESTLMQIRRYMAFVGKAADATGATIDEWIKRVGGWMKLG